MIRILLFPVPHYWLVAVVWGLFFCLPVLYLARAKNRSPLGWCFLSAITGFFFGILGASWIVLLATREKLDMRTKYLEYKIDEQIAEALNLPSPVGDNIEKRILMVLAYNPQGLRIGAVAQGIGQNWRSIDALVKQMLNEGKVRKEEDRYFFNLD